MRFSRDRRGQSVVIGTVVLFGFLIVALSLYQVQVVPQQSGQAEFEHYEDVQNDLVELRNGILSAGSSERPQFVDVKLGTSYQTRVFTINPPDPAGTLRTSDAYNITITDDSNTTVNVSTRFIEYRPRYNEIESGSTWIDNSVLYVDEADSNRPAVIVEDQNLVVDNDTLRLTAVQNEFSTSGTRKVSVELYPTSDATNLSNLSGGLDVRIPTRLGSEDGYWNESIENGSVTYQGMDDTAYNSSEVSALLLRVDNPDNITVNSVGIQREPTGETARDNVGPASSGGDGSGSGGDGGTTVLYPSSGTGNAGTWDNIENMQADDGNIAQLEGISGGGGNKQEFDVTTTTNNVPAGDYTLEIQVGSGSSFQGGGTDITVSDASGVIGSGTISETGLFTIDLSSSVEGDITVNYQGGNQNTELKVQFQRLV